MVEVILESLPEGMGQAVIQAWYFEEGDAVTKGDEIAELATEERNVTVIAPASGILAEVYYDEGETVEAGEILCLIEEEGSVDEEEGKKDKREEEE